MATESKESVRVESSISLIARSWIVFTVPFGNVRLCGIISIYLCLFTFRNSWNVDKSSSCLSVCVFCFHTHKVNSLYKVLLLPNGFYFFKTKTYQSLSCRTSGWKIQRIRKKRMIIEKLSNGVEIGPQVCSVIIYYYKL